ncbi:MAG: hypothetical protein ACD_49C00079G0001 [uncultured bacterium (gcode 4)]|uniref:Uncharacterized protein n=1 Tax=uncultured bacterium (gcode 4) TaxID=1234023 RepID=K2AVD6_9BACT|nr:MAG: hypothetical protein ACD_49C00079G0001 [uncultured bacterium (gcode 4)]
MTTNFVDFPYGLKDNNGKIIDSQIAEEMAYIEKPYRENELGMLKSMFSCRANEILKWEKKAEYIWQKLFEKKRKNHELEMQKQKEIRLNNLLNDFELIVEQNVKRIYWEQWDELHNKTLSIINSLMREGVLRDRWKLTQEPSQVFFYKNSWENFASTAWDERVSIDFWDKKMNERILNILIHWWKQVIFEILWFEKAREWPRDFPADKIFTLSEFKKHFGKKINPPKAYYV